MGKDRRIIDAYYCTMPVDFISVTLGSGPTAHHRARRICCGNRRCARRNRRRRDAGRKAVEEAGFKGKCPMLARIEDGGVDRVNACFQQL